MNPAAFPLASVVVLSFVDKLGTWWGILIVAATLPIAYAVSVSRDARARQIAAHGLSDDEDDTNVFGFFGITLPAVAAAIGGHFIRHGWGALIGGVVIAFIASAIFAVLISRNTPEPW